MSFFIREGQNKKLSGIKRKFSDKKSTKKFKKQPENEEISSDSDFESDQNNLNDAEESSEDENLTTQERRLKLAKVYLEEIKRQEEKRAEEKEFHESNVSQRLKDDLLEQTGRLHKNIADTIDRVDVESIHRWKTKCNRDAVTCIVLSKDNDTLYSATKSGVITMYSLKTKQKTHSLPFKKVKEPQEKLHIRDLSISFDNKFLAVAQGKNIIIRDGKSLNEVHIFKGHSTDVTGVVFRQDSHQLFSCSNDRSVKVWSCDQMSYIETLFGHQSGITSIDALFRERAITSGGYDCTLRVWKIPEDSQLIYNGHSGSIDCVKLINEQTFVSGGNDGSLHVWGSMKKKPLCTIKNAHGIDSTNDLPNWIVCIAALLNSDLVASGSYDGFIRLWKVTDSFRNMKQILEIPVNGFVNQMMFSQNGDYLIAAIGREHRSGRWWNKTDAVNSVIIIPLVKKNKKN
ncbi:U3 small nucleolar RNA-interacting protein 2 [Chrysoperla carnea]|uniref:U3 small nucleolar RNA-interacting protein 2 n=1 Tax=Chrysoperla carnea TaxID=189513 RepID=UPI001D082A18|nr:U3 small nucleolar RNA-interacting protein 2 [Chrysoperla carnea]